MTSARNLSSVEDFIESATELRNVVEYLIGTYGNEIGDRDEGYALNAIDDFDWELANEVFM